MQMVENLLEQLANETGVEASVSYRMDEWGGEKLRLTLPYSPEDAVFDNLSWQDLWYTVWGIVYAFRVVQQMAGVTVEDSALFSRKVTP